MRIFSGVICFFCWFIGVYLAQVSVFLTRRFYDNGFGDTGGIAAGRVMRFFLGVTAVSLARAQGGQMLGKPRSCAKKSKPPPPDGEVVVRLTSMASVVKNECANCGLGGLPGDQSAILSSTEGSGGPNTWRTRLFSESSTPLASDDEVMVRLASMGPFLKIERAHCGPGALWLRFGVRVRGG
jgi:hypothetical protein